MRRLFLLSGFFFYSFGATAQMNNINIPDSIKSDLDTIINIVQTKSLFRKDVDWAMLKDSVYFKANNAQKVADIIPAVQYLFKKIGDEHGAIIFKGRWYGNMYQSKPMRKSLREQLMAEMKKGELTTIKTAILSNGYGYIRIPAIKTSKQEDINRYAQQIQDSICKLNPNKLKGWIIDLRLNPGGSMFPMIAGIGSLIGDGVCGAFVDPIGNTKTKWIIKSDDLYFDNQQLTKVEKKCLLNKLPKIAVLIGQVTASSGEATAIALKGRPNTKFFGEKTSGYVTANQGYQIDKNIKLEVAESYYADRNGVVYKHFVMPDVELVEGDDFSDLSKDVKVQAALQWLENSR